MKHTLLLLALALPASAELLATFNTSRGNVIVSLHYDKTPQTVANFITLAQGTRSRIDPATGAVIRKPLYAGEKFFRVVNDPFSGQYAQTGSGTGNQAGSPGYTIRDEFNPTLRHDGYVLSMANAGQPHTNGSQIFLTGSAPIPEFDDSYTVFGKITALASRAVIDEIMSGGSDGTTINSVSFQRTSPEAVAFNEHAQKLPVCSAFPGKLEVVHGVECTYLTDNFQPAGSIFQFYKSSNLQSWSFVGDIFQGTGVVGDVDRFILDNAQSSREFFNISLITYPDALAPASMANRRIEFRTATTRKFIVNYDATGFAGTFEDTENAGVIVGIASSSYDSSPYKAEWIYNLSNGKRFGFSCILDTESAVEIIGRNSSFEFVGTWMQIGSGGLVLSKP